MIQALALLLVTSLGCGGLFSAWAATSPRHWFFRTGLFAAGLALLLLIPAYEPLVVFLLQGVVVAMGVQLVRWWRWQAEGKKRAPRQTRFTLATLLLATVYVAMAAAVAVRLPTLNDRAWSSVVLIGVAAGLATLLGLWVAHGRLVRWPLRVGLVLVLTLSLSIPLAWGDWFILSTEFYQWPPTDAVSYGGMYGVYGEGEPILVWVPILLGIATISGIAAWLFTRLAVTGQAVISPPGCFSSRWKRLLAGSLLILLVFVLLLPPVGVYYQLLTPLPIPALKLPDPNGWDDLVAAGKMVENSNSLSIINNYDAATQSQLATAVKTLAPAYQRLNIGLERPGLCPVSYDGPGKNIDSISAMRTLARALAGRGRLATLEGRFEDAADSFLECTRFGYAVRRGGLIVDALVGIACSGIGYHNLYAIRLKLPSAQCSKLVRVLSSLERQAEPAADSIQRDRIWSHKGYLLYSVGSNGTDDDGTAPDEEDPGGFSTGDLRLDICYAPDPESAAGETLEDNGSFTKATEETAMADQEDD